MGWWPRRIHHGTRHDSTYRMEVSLGMTAQSVLMTGLTTILRDRVSAATHEGTRPEEQSIR